MFGSGRKITFQHTVEGTWGEFVTPAGRVAYLMTKARLGQTGTDFERRLTAQLRPVREVLDPKRLDFNQLLQRDLDDHRVATQLLPYLLQSSQNGPAFFPPIMAVLLPFNGNTPSEHFPAKDYEQPDDVDGVAMRTERYGSAYQVRRLINQDDNSLHSIKLGRMSWNDEQAKLVVLDGQHRAMALIAIDRTVNESWKSNTGEKFRHFYEHRVKKLIESAGNKINLDQVEVPVTVCWFPELNGKSANPHRAARKIFVDVNKEARTPSEARLVLLSDTSLRNVFTRCLLNRLRQPQPPMPLFAIEYDNPDKDSARPVRWTVLTNLNLLKSAVEYTLFCPTKYLTDMGTRFGGRPPLIEMNARMRAQLELEAHLPEVIDDGDTIVERGHISDDTFPPSELELLKRQFMDSWGDAILVLLGRVAPYAAHCRALQTLHDQWLTDDAMASLAHDALFVGVGMYWTLRSSHQHWVEEKREAKRNNQPKPAKPDIVKSWEIIDKKAGEFEVHRAIEYLGSGAEKAVRDASDLFGMVNTHACQLGMVMTFSTLAHQTGIQANELSGLAGALADAWNSALVSNVNMSRNRRCVFSRTVSNPINRLGKMDTPFAVFFRYFWLELLSLEGARAHLAAFASPELLDQLTSESREAYLDFLVREQAKSLKNSNPQWTKGACNEKALAVEAKELKKALAFWFGMEKEAFDTWLDATSLSRRLSQTEIVVEEEEPAEDEAPTENAGADEVLGEIDEDE